jgi:hypothetical protein
MRLYQIKDHEVPLFPIKYVRYIFGITKFGIYQKEKRGHLPNVNFRDENSRRLYSIEDLAIIDYIYREVWPYKQGVKVPEWVKEMVTEALAISKQVVIQYGCSQSPDDWLEIDQRYKKFSRYRLQTYIESWRNRLLDVDKFFPELVSEDEDW